MKSKTKAVVPARITAPIASITIASAFRHSTHAEIAASARILWEKSGRPCGKDTAIWLEAERRLRPGAGLTASDSGVFAETRAMLGESKGSIDTSLDSFGGQLGDRSATSL